MIPEYLLARCRQGHILTARNVGYRKSSGGYCLVCQRGCARRNYTRARAAGAPSWVAAGRTYGGYIRLAARNRQYDHAHPALLKEEQKRYREKMKCLYGVCVPGRDRPLAFALKREPPRKASYV